MEATPWAKQTRATCRFQPSMFRNMRRGAMGTRERGGTMRGPRNRGRIRVG